MRGDAETERSVPLPGDSGLKQAAVGLGAQVVEAEAGVHFVKDLTWTAGARHGSAEVGRGPLHPLLLREAGAEAGGRVLYLDTETTGLSGGAGTFAFLIGVGSHDADGFRVRQLLLPGPEHEVSQLQAFAGLAAGASAVVTYNGGSFDLPLLRGRFALHGLADPLWQVPHLDLLTLARRLWKQTLPDCSLATVERRIMGVIRDHDDVPGAEVPARYQTWLRNRNPEELSGVLGHNATDIVALTALRSHIERLLLQPDSGRPAELQGLGLWLARLGEGDRALDHLLEAGAKRPEAAWQASLLLKRAGRLSEAADLWLLLGQGGSAAAWVELAKYQEHVLRDFAAALDSVAAASACRDAVPAELERRRLRLLRRQSYGA